MRKTKRVSAGIAVALTLSTLLAAEEPCKLVVHSANPGVQIKKATVVAIFMKQMTQWSDGSPILPVDQSTQSPVRKAFSEQILGQSVASVQNQWMGLISRNHMVPPTVKPSDRDVLAYVQATAGAIGYVSATATLEGSVKVLKVVD